MSISIYYTGKRATLLSVSELHAVNTIAEKYSVNSAIEARSRTGRGLNWESFHYLTNTEKGSLLGKGVVFEGATKLPDNSADATWEGVQHWCRCLSEIRHALSGVDWSVAVDDHPIQWDPKRNEYDPSK